MNKLKALREKIEKEIDKKKLSLLDIRELMRIYNELTENAYSFFISENVKKILKSLDFKVQHHGVVSYSVII